MRKFHSLQLLLLLLMIFFCISILFDTIVETHPTETKKEIWKKLRERESRWGEQNAKVGCRIVGF